MKYVILDAYEINDLQKKVNSYITEGYKPVGGVATTNHKDGFVEYIQGMLKEE